MSPRTRAAKKGKGECRDCPRKKVAGSEYCQLCKDKRSARAARAPKKGSQHCKACGQPGHNRRSKFCPKNGGGS